MGCNGTTNHKRGQVPTSTHDIVPEKIDLKDVYVRIHSTPEDQVVRIKYQGEDEFVHLGKTPIDKTMKLKPKPFELFTDVNVVFGTHRVEPNKKVIFDGKGDLFVHSFKVIDRGNEIKSDFDKFDQNTQKSIVEIISSFEMAYSSPMFLFPSKVQESRALINNLYIDKPELKNTPMLVYIEETLAGMQRIADIPTSMSRLRKIELITQRNYLPTLKFASGQI